MRLILARTLSSLKMGQVCRYVIGCRKLNRMRSLSRCMDLTTTAVFLIRRESISANRVLRVLLMTNAGFGMAPKRGLWAGGETYTKDLQALVQLVKQRYPTRPVYLLGESMGGAVVITAMSQADMPKVAGIILAAPALWARSTMPWYQTSLLWTLAHSLPWLTLTGEGVHVVASDNIDMLRAMGRDPLVIKATRVETVYGLTDLMDAAFNSASLLRGNTLMLYGEKDEIIPKEPTYAFLQRFLATNSTEKTVAIYQHGYHMLLRDLQAPTTWKDIVAWINASPDKLPSGADNRARQLLSSR